MRYVLHILVGSLLMLSLGCGTDNNPVQVVIPSDPCISFEPAELPVSGEVVTRFSADNTCDELEGIVEVVGTDIDDVFSVATHIDYDQTAVVFQGLEVGDSVLAQDGAQLIAHVEDDGGQLTIGVSRNADDTVDIVGTQVLMKLYFYPVDFGTSDMDVQTPCLTSGGKPPVPLNNVSCSGGTFSVEQIP